jgi:hypothetical protein
MYDTSLAFVSFQHDLKFSVSCRALSRAKISWFVCLTNGMVFPALPMEVELGNINSTHFGV